MARSDYSSDPDDGSITSEASAHEDEHAIGPASAIAQQNFAPQQLGHTDQSSSVATAAAIAPNLGVSSPNKSTGGDEIQLKSPTTPSRRPRIPDLMSSKITGRNARFRSAVMKVIRLNQICSLSDDEPGVNVLSGAAAAIYGHIRERCSIDVMDYGPTRFKHTKLSNEELGTHIVSAFGSGSILFLVFLFLMHSDLRPGVLPRCFAQRDNYKTVTRLPSSAPRLQGSSSLSHRPLPSLTTFISCQNRLMDPVQGHSGQRYAGSTSVASPGMSSKH